MRVIFILIFPSFLLANYWNEKDINTLALVRDPVANFYFHVLDDDSPISYSKPCLQNFKQYKKRCPSHQGLFNEVVTIVSNEGKRVKVAFDNLVYGFNPVTGEPLQTFWVNSSNLIFCKNLSEKARQTLPLPSNCSNGTITLVLPWSGYSVGTRFVREPKNDTDAFYGIKTLDPLSYQVQYLLIPKDTAREETFLSSKEKKALLAQLAYQLVEHASASFPGGVIPYALGGSSYVHTYEDNLFWEELSCFRRVGQSHPYTGYDCSELVFRLTKMSGITYLAKTVAAAKKLLKPIHNSLEEGDLIVFSGHMLIVGSLKRNEVIEARGYESGYGKVHILTLEKCFKGITSYDDLWRAYKENQPLYFLNKQGDVYLEIKSFCFLSLL